MSSNDDNNQRCGNGGGGSNGGEMISSKKEECSSCEQNNFDNITEGFNSMAIRNDISTCANCGKEGNSEEMNTCNKCKMVKYCNAACKKKHRKKHKKACEKRVAELHEEQLFKDVEPDECPICLIPTLTSGQSVFKSCCGKVICNGCIYAMLMSEGGKDLCAFCRTPPARSDEEMIKRTKKLMEKDNAEAFHQLAGYYADGECGLVRDQRKANELYLKAGELGCSKGYYLLGMNHYNGRGVAIDKKKAKHYYELAAICGDIHSRHNLGCIEYNSGNYDRSLKHFIISAKAGHELSLVPVKKGYEQGLVSKDEYTNTLRSYHERQKEMKSDARDKAAAILDRR